MCPEHRLPCAEDIEGRRGAPDVVRCQAGHEVGAWLVVGDRGQVVAAADRWEIYLSAPLLAAAEALANLNRWNLVPTSRRRPTLPAPDGVLGRLAARVLAEGGSGA